MSAIATVPFIFLLGLDEEERPGDDGHGVSDPHCTTGNLWRMSVGSVFSARSWTEAGTFLALIFYMVLPVLLSADTIPEVLPKLPSTS